MSRASQDKLPHKIIKTKAFDLTGKVDKVLIMGDDFDKYCWLIDRERLAVGCMSVSLGFLLIFFLFAHSNPSLLSVLFEIVTGIATGYSARRWRDLRKERKVFINHIKQKSVGMMSN